MFSNTLMCGVKRVVLKHHGDVSLDGSRSLTTLPPMQTSPPLTSSRPRPCATVWIAAATGADDDNKFAVLDLRADAMDDLVGGLAGAVAFDDIF